MTHKFVPLTSEPDEERVHAEYLLLKARREALRRVDAEQELADDFDALYLDRKQLDSLTIPPAFIPGVIFRGSFGIVRGRDGTLKSFLCQDIGLCLSTGQPWNSIPVEPAHVLYIAGEGVHGIPPRARAWEAERGVTVDPQRFTVRREALNLYRPGAAFDHLLEYVTDYRVDVVIVDTLRRVSGGADGNSSEMGAVVDNLHRLKLATADGNGTVVVVAHTDKGDNDTRGFSGIEDDADFVWHARRDGNTLELELTKAKDAPDGTKIKMTAWPVAGSLVLRPALAAAPRDEGAESEARLLSVLRYTFPDGAFSGALFEVADLPKTTYYRALSALVKSGEVVKSGAKTRPYYEARQEGESHRVPRPIPAGPKPVPSPETASDLHVSHGSHSSPIHSPTSPTPLIGEGERDSELRDQTHTRESNPEGRSASGGLTTEQLAIVARIDCLPPATGGES